MKIKRIMIVSVFCLLLPVLTGCHDDWWDDWWEDWDLEGRWEVSEVARDGSIIATYPIYIDQHNSRVEFLRSHETLSNGWISGALIACDDWYGYGIDVIYIDSNRRMHSERPENRRLEKIEFQRIR